MTDPSRFQLYQNFSHPQPVYLAQYLLESRSVLTHDESGDIGHCKTVKIIEVRTELENLQVMLDSSEDALSRTLVRGSDYVSRVSKGENTNFGNCETTFGSPSVDIAQSSYEILAPRW